MPCPSLDAIPNFYALDKFVSPIVGEMMSGNTPRGMTARSIAVASVSVAVLFGLVGAGAGAAEAAVPPRVSLTTSTVLQPTNPPGPCNPEEVGQQKVGPDGQLYVCVAQGSAAKSTVSLTRDDLSQPQLDNFNRFMKKLPVAAEEPTITRLADGSIQFEAKVPGRVPGSYALYTKTIDEGGNTTNYTKTTVLPDGSVAHTKIKYP